jgi:hypothetical protein
MTPRPETTLEGRVFLLTVGVILLGVLLLNLGFTVGDLGRRVAALEAATTSGGEK